MPAPRALIFDCDGTLADTMPLHWHAWQVIAQRHGIHFTEDRFYALGGVPSRDILKTLREEQGLSYDHHVVSVEKEHAFLPFLSTVQGIPQVIAIAREHHGKLPMAVASGGKKRIVEEVLQHLGIRQWFAAVVTSEDVTRQKPEPDIFLEAARRLGVAPQFCRGYEDTELGMTAIRAAGMEAVDVRELGVVVR
ncbi:MAG: HAD family hydrolase [Pedosphaera sp. Tous-C6FEB]|nr:MAG: HAD family hydrolase [Pedosphaera sp. Tous-C6FEB]